MSVRQKYIKLATMAAARSKCRYPIGAVLVHRGRVLAASANIFMRPATRTNFRWCTLHAEEAVTQQPSLPKGDNCLCG